MESALERSNESPCAIESRPASGPARDENIDFIAIYCRAVSSKDERTGRRRLPHIGARRPIRTIRLRVGSVISMFSSANEKRESERQRQTSSSRVYKAVVVKENVLKERQREVKSAWVPVSRFPTFGSSWSEGIVRR